MRDEGGVKGRVGVWLVRCEERIPRSRRDGIVSDLGLGDERGLAWAKVVSGSLADRLTRLGCISSFDLRDVIGKQ